MASQARGASALRASFASAPAAPSPAAAAISLPSRVLSVDLLRGWDVWLMLFVNEMAGVRGTPAFLRHRPPAADGMTITDVVFPAFLFIIGMAIPLALGGRLRRGEARASVWRHVLVRTAALLVMGVLMVNAEMASAHGLMPPSLWSLLMTLGVVLVWAAPAEPGDGVWPRRARAAGIVLLAVLVLVFRADGVSGLVQIRPYWWGILGLIGWAYLVGSAVYLRLGDRPWTLAGAMALLYVLALAAEAAAGGARQSSSPLVWAGRVLAAHGALVVSGAVLTVALLRHRNAGKDPVRFLAPALAYALALGAAALLIHAFHDVSPAFWFNKVRATPAWCLLSAAWTVAAWAVAYLLADVRGWRRWPRAMGMAGENALMIYLLAPFLLSLFDLVGLLAGRNPYEALRAGLFAGVWCSVVFAWVVVRLSGGMGARGLRLRL